MSLCLSLIGHSILMLVILYGKLISLISSVFSLLFKKSCLWLSKSENLRNPFLVGTESPSPPPVTRQSCILYSFNLSIFLHSPCPPLSVAASQWPGSSHAPHLWSIMSKSIPLHPTLVTFEELSQPRPAPCTQTGGDHP